LIAVEAELAREGEVAQRLDQPVHGVVLIGLDLLGSQAVGAPLPFALGGKPAPHLRARGQRVDHEGRERLRQQGGRRRRRGLGVGRKQRGGEGEQEQVSHS
jgi:hypothetical protein